MKKYTVLVSLLIASFILSAWSNDQINEKKEKDPRVRKELDLKNFDQVSVCCGIKLHLITNKENTFYAEGREEDLNNLNISYKNNELSISKESEGWGFWKIFVTKGSCPVNVYLSNQGMKVISASSGSQVKLDEVFESSNLEIDMSSGAYGQFNLNVDRLSVECSSGSEVKLTGIALDVDIDSSSGSQCDAKDLSSYKSAKIEASSGAKVELTAQGQVIGDASSGAEINIYGYPNEVTKDESSGGYLRLINKI